MITQPNGYNLQIYDVVKGVDPRTRIRYCNGDNVEIGEMEATRIMGRGVGRIREGFRPRLDCGSG